MDPSDLVLGLIISIGCASTVVFLIGLLLVDVSDAGWRINAPWHHRALR